MKIPEKICVCGYKMNAIIESSSPKENDISLCGRCAKVWIFNEDLTMREPTNAELERIRYHQDYQGTREEIRKIKSRIKH